MTYSHLQADFLTLLSAPDPTLGNEYEKPYLLPPLFGVSVGRDHFGVLPKYLASEN